MLYTCATCGFEAQSNGDPVDGAMDATHRPAGWSIAFYGHEIWPECPACAVLPDNIDVATQIYQRQLALELEVEK